jgi:hypothetical protein
MAALEAVFPGKDKKILTHVLLSPAQDIGQSPT